MSAYRNDTTLLVVDVSWVYHVYNRAHGDDGCIRDCQHDHVGESELGVRQS